MADAICARLEAQNLRCWIAPRNIVPGTSYAAAIIDGINNTKTMVVILTEQANLSRHVIGEVERAMNKGVPIIPVLLEKIVLAKDLEYFLSAGHWLDAMTPPLERHIDRLAESVKTLLKVERPELPPETKTQMRKVMQRFEEIAPNEWTTRGNAKSWIRKLFAEKL
jgi:hypothetical protein